MNKCNAPALGILIKRLIFSVYTIGVLITILRSRTFFNNWSLQYQDQMECNIPIMLREQRIDYWTRRVQAFKKGDYRGSYQKTRSNGNMHLQIWDFFLNVPE
jgi:hypothetical protein